MNEGKSHVPVVLVAVVDVLIIGQAAPSQVLGLALHLHKGYWSEDCTLHLEEGLKTVHYTLQLTCNQ